MIITLDNIQSIEHAVYDLPDKGFVKIEGGNSNGKSILVKSIGAITSLQIMDTEKRRALINDNCNSGSVIIEYKGKSLLVKLHEDRNSCFVALIRENGEKIIRTFRDGGIEELLNEFGFRIYNKNQICLQVYETFGLMPFCNTSTEVNGEIVEAVTEDAIAKDFLKNFKEVTYKRIKEMVKNINEKIEGIKRVKESLLVFNYREYEKRSAILREKLEVLMNLEPVEINMPKPPLNTELLDVWCKPLEELALPVNFELLDIMCSPIKELALPVTIPVCESVNTLRLPIVIPTCESMSDLSNILEEVHTILGGVCPTCGKQLISNSCCS